ncbi:MAG TPA: SDR family oxidoreductase [Burkholderiaceae bacterium]|jgi:nucleoside-diphosphate-sugar epimerase|nr:SDR family oxidoreductase [Burkholderiaceae bacterium]
MKNVALVAGATGVVGRALIEHLGGRTDWEAISVARRAERHFATGRHLSVDLLDAQACRDALSDAVDITHVFYTAYLARPNDSAQETALNLTMLRNLIEAIEAVAPGLRHVQLMQGSKWYGSHVGPYRTPAREDQPRHPQAAFYFEQQKWLTRKQQDNSWTWSALRPHGIWGYTESSNLSPMNAIALYATVMKRLGLPLHFPGKRNAYDALYQCTEAAHLAKGMVWAATAPQAANQVFNLTNGDYVRWRYAWPVIAEWFGMEIGDVIPMSLSDFMADKQPLWDEIVAEHKLIPHRLQDLTVFKAAETYIFNAEWDQMSANTKAQKAGWTEVVDTYEMFPRQLQRLVDERMIPAP